MYIKSEDVPLPLKELYISDMYMAGVTDAGEKMYMLERDEEGLITKIIDMDTGDEVNIHFM